MGKTLLKFKVKKPKVRVVMPTKPNKRHKSVKDYDRKTLKASDKKTLKGDDG